MTPTALEPFRSGNFRKFPGVSDPYHYNGFVFDFGGGPVASVFDFLRGDPLREFLWRAGSESSENPTPLNFLHFSGQKQRIFGAARAASQIGPEWLGLPSVPANWGRLEGQHEPARASSSIVSALIHGNESAAMRDQGLSGNLTGNFHPLKPWG